LIKRRERTTYHAVEEGNKSLSVSGNLLAAGEGIDSILKEGTAPGEEWQKGRKTFFPRGEGERGGGIGGGIRKGIWSGGSKGGAGDDWEGLES